MSRGDDYSEHPFFVGDSDLVLLGVAAGLAARYHALRKGITIQNDANYLAQVAAGLAFATGMHIEDVPDVFIGVYCSKKTLEKMRAIADEGLKAL